MNRRGRRGSAEEKFLNSELPIAPTTPPTLSSAFNLISALIVSPLRVLCVLCGAILLVYPDTARTETVARCGQRLAGANQWLSGTASQRHALRNRLSARSPAEGGRAGEPRLPGQRQGATAPQARPGARCRRRPRSLDRQHSVAARAAQIFRRDGRAWPPPRDSKVEEVRARQLHSRDCSIVPASP